MSCGAEYFDEGVLLFDSAKYAKAIENFDKAIQCEHNIEEALLKKSHSLICLGKYSDAIDCFDKCLRINSNCAEAYIYKGVCYMENGRTKEATRLFVKANRINVDLNDWNSLLIKGLTLKFLAVKDKAIEFVDRSLRIHPTPEAFKIKGDILWETNQPTKALESYNMAIDLNENYFVAHWNKGSLLHSLEKYNDAIKSYNRAISLNPTSAIYKEKAEAHLALKEKEKAVQCYINAISLDPNDKDSSDRMNLILDESN